MSTSDGRLFDARPSLNLADLHALTARTANYTSANDPELVLRRGLVEEIFEYTFELEQRGEPSPFELEGELGDVLWYVSEISRHEGISAATLLDDKSLDEFQATNPPLTIPILDREGHSLEPETSPHAVLAITALRTVDVLNPKNKGLWIGLESRPDLATTIKDLLIAVGWLATANNLTMSAAVEHTLHKLHTRTRKPHVIEEADARQAVSSGRERLSIDPLVKKLLRETIYDQGFLN